MKQQKTPQIAFAVALALAIDGKQEQVEVKIPGGMQLAHGKGLDGVADVKSLAVGTSPDYPGQTFVSDQNGNTIAGTADELFVAAQFAARAQGYELTAKKIATT